VTGGLYYYIFVSSRSATILGSPALYYYILVSSRAATNLGSPALYYYIFVSSRAAMNLGSPALYYYIFVSSRAATNLGSPALYYYIFVSSRAATILGSPALWGRLVACGRLSIGQMPLTSSTPRLRLAALRGRFNLRPIANRPVFRVSAGDPQMIYTTSAVESLPAAYNDRQAGCQPAAGCHPAPPASDSTFMSHIR
jgi:hypothetical protein